MRVGPGGRDRDFSRLHGRRARFVPFTEITLFPGEPEAAPRPPDGVTPGPLRDKPLRTSFPPKPDMAELAKEIIRQPWPLRHHRDPRLRAQARSLIRTHVVMLRKWRTAAALVR